MVTCDLAEIIIIIPLILNNNKKINCHEAKFKAQDALNFQSNEKSVTLISFHNTYSILLKFNQSPTSQKYAAQIIK